jgi:hypothetical protein
MNQVMESYITTKLSEMTEFLNAYAVRLLSSDALCPAQHIADTQTTTSTTHDLGEIRHQGSG